MMSNSRMLIIGKEPKNSIALPAFLEQQANLQCACDSAKDCEEALALLSQRPYQMIVLWADAASDFAVVRRLREEHPGLPIMTMNSSPDALLAQS